MEGPEQSWNGDTEGAKKNDLNIVACIGYRA